MHGEHRIHILIPTAYVDDNALSYAKQIAKPNKFLIGDITGWIRNNWNQRPPEHIYKFLGWVYVADCLLRWIDRAGTILDSGDIIAGIITAITTLNSPDISTWVAKNAVMIGVIGYLIWPTITRLLTAIHKLLFER